ncbi:hypothetical protein LCGC14_1970400, partial [marine sediment metagenome]
MVNDMNSEPTARFTTEGTEKLLKDMARKILDLQAELDKREATERALEKASADLRKLEMVIPICRDVAALCPKARLLPFPPP